MGETECIVRPLAVQVVDPRVTEHPTALRFAVATFDTWDGLRGTLQNLGADGLGSDAVSLLGLIRVLSAPAVRTHLPAAAYQALPIPGNQPLIWCTAGLLAERLAGKLLAGAPTLNAALGHWLIPRHAAEIADAVENGRIVLWVQLFDSEGEHRAYRSLLAGSSHSVGVHDLVAD